MTVGFSRQAIENQARFLVRRGRVVVLPVVGQEHSDVVVASRHFALNSRVRWVGERDLFANRQSLLMGVDRFVSQPRRTIDVADVVASLRQIALKLHVRGVFLRKLWLIANTFLCDAKAFSSRPLSRSIFAMLWKVVPSNRWYSGFDGFSRARRSRMANDRLWDFRASESRPCSLCTVPILLRL